MKKSLLKFSLLLICFSQGQLLTAEIFDHSLFDSILQKHVQNGLVDYSSIQVDTRGELNKYLTNLESVTARQYEEWTINEQIVFWINAYNAITIEGILRNYPIEYGGLIARTRFPKSSIRQISKFWDTAFVNLLGKEVTLNEIEHEILRGEFKDPRIHFVLVCASIGCPLLENRAFVSENLDSRLDLATRDFVQNNDKVRLDRASETLYLSSIFDWYKKDFFGFSKNLPAYSIQSAKDRDLIGFAAEYMTKADRQYIQSNQVNIKYLKYDWSLNEKL